MTPDHDPLDWLRCHPRTTGYLLFITSLNLVLNILQVIGVI